MNKMRIHPIWKALIISVILVGVSAFWSLTWETNDDTGIAFLLSRYANDYSPFQWRVLTVCIHFLYVHIPVIDWWSVCSLFAIWISSFAFTYVIYQRYPRGYSFVLSIAGNVLLWFVALYRMNFTRTAISVAMAGCLLVADSVFVRRMKKSLWAEYVLGCILILFGASIRKSCALIALGFLAVIGLVRLIGDNFSFCGNWFKSHMRQIVMLWTTALIFLAACVVHEKILTSEQREYEKYNNIRASIQDYVGRYPAYESAQESYSAMGLNNNALSMLFNWFSEDTEILTLETLEKIAELGTRTLSFQSFLTMLDKHKLVTFLAFALIGILLWGRKANWLRSGAVVGAALLCWSYLIVQGRIPARTYMSILWALICAAVFVSGKDDREMEEAWPCGCIAQNKRVIKLVADKLVIIGVLAISGLGLWRAGRLLAIDVDSNTISAKQIKRAQNREVFDCIDADENHIYIFDFIYAPGSMSDAFSFWELRPAHYCDNRFALGGWNVRHPFNVGMLSQYGIINPVRALFERTDVYSTYSPRLHQYMCDYYNSGITVSETGSLNGIPIVQYTLPIEDDQITGKELASSSLIEFNYIGTTNIEIWHFSAEVDVTEKTDEDPVFYCNVTVDGIRLTFRLKYENGIVSAYLYGIPEMFDVETADLVIFELTDEGQYIEYSFGE